MDWASFPDTLPGWFEKIIEDNSSPLEISENEVQEVNFVVPYLVSSREKDEYVLNTNMEYEYVDNFDRRLIVGIQALVWLLCFFFWSAVKHENTPPDISRFANEPPPNIPPPDFTPPDFPPPTYREAVKPLAPLETKANLSVDTFGVV